jgi:CHAT domain-containing protein/tetratricopeptide (TPR) repeat protein
MNWHHTCLCWLWLAAVCFAQSAPEEQLAARIATAQTEAERATLLNSATGLALPKLVLALVAEADKRRDKGEYKEAGGLYTFAQTAAERTRDQAGVALALDRLGVLYFRQDDYPQALKLHQQSLALRQQSNDKKAVAETLDNMGKVYQWQEDYDKSLDHYQQALALRAEVGDRKGVAQTLQNLGSMYSNQRHYPLASEHFQRSLQIKEDLGDKEGAAITLNSLGGVAYSQSDYTQAAERFQRALASFEELGQAPRVGVMRGNLATMHTQLGNYDLALELLRQSLAAAEAVNNKSIIQSALTTIGNVYFYQGDTSRSLEYYQKALAIAEPLGIKNNLGNLLYNIAGVYDRQGNYELALDYFQKSLTQRSAIQDKTGIADSLNRIGNLYLEQGDHRQALDHQQRSLLIYEELKDKNSIGGVFVSFGDVYRKQNDLVTAIAYYERALKIYEEVGVRRNLIAALNNLAETHLAKSNYAQALNYAEHATALVHELNTQIGLPAARTTAGRALLALKEPARAEQAFNEAIRSIEALREFVAGGERERQLFFAKSVGPYYTLVDLLVGQRRFAEALIYAERAKGRVLLDVIGSGRGNITKSLSAAEQSHERSLTNELFSLNAQLTRERQQDKPDAQRVQELETRLGQARRAYEDFENQLYTAHPELRLKRGEARILKPEQAIALLPDAQTALLEYAVSDDRAYLFVLTRGGAPNRAGVNLQAYPLAVKRKELAAQVESFRRAIEERDLEFVAPARRLYDLLLAPARAQLQDKTKLVIVPDDALWGLPFQALQPARNRYLLEDATLSYAPSLSVLYEIAKLQRRAPAEMRLLAFGNPALGAQTVARAQTVLRSGAQLDPLPEAEQEVQALAQLYGTARSRVYTGTEAREARVKDEAGQFSVLHFATHGVFNDTSPLYSHLVLAQSGAGEDGLLEAWELMKLELKADLVVLSACETGRGRTSAGEGLIGLSWALFVAGSPTTVVSQWKVASGATRQLMTNFHRQLRARTAKAEALRAAALPMLRSGQHRHPFYWAGFILVGASQ